MKCLIIAGLAESLVNFRGPLLRTLVARGHAVHVAAPGLAADPVTCAALKEIGVQVHEIPFDRTGLSPASDLRCLRQLTQLMRAERIEAVMGYTIKPVIWGLLAARAARVPHRFALITGLGYAFTGEATGKRRLVQLVARGLYKLALRGAHKVMFQNPDDEALFRDQAILPARIPSVVVNGSGVDLDHFPRMPLPDGPPQFLLIARLLGDKGIREYMRSARALRADHPGCVFHILGGLDSNPDGIKEAEIRNWQDEGLIEWHGSQPDVRPYLAACHVYVLPSYYREGTPRTILEALATGRAVVTTDAPGCRETVTDGENGFLVPVRDAPALTAALRRFAEDPALIERMGAASYRLAQDKYDVHKVNAVMLREMGL